MNPNMIPLYGYAVLAVTTLGLFARQNRKSGWKRERAESTAAALAEFYSDLGVVLDGRTPDISLQVAPLTPEEELGFSAQMLKLRSALGASLAVTQDPAAFERELAVKQ